MKALVLAGGEGLRLKPLLGALPKCLAPVQGRPFIERQIELLRAHRIREVVLCVGIGANTVKETLGDGRRLGVSIQYSVESVPLGTAGAIANASALLEDRFLCVNGDTLAEFSLARMKALHERRGAEATVLCRKVADSTGRGTLVVGDRREIVRFDEKVAAGSPGLINCGFYLMQKSITERVAPGRSVSLEREVFPQLLRHGLRLLAFETTGAFVDIGTPEEYLRVRDRGWR